MERRVILVVDDDQDARESIAALLELRSFVVYAVGSVAAGMALLVAQHVDVLVSDLDLGPGPSGDVLLDFAAARFPAMGRVLFTGRPRAERINADAIVTKPNIDVLASEVTAFARATERRPRASSGSRREA